MCSEFVLEPPHVDRSKFERSFMPSAKPSAHLIYVPQESFTVAFNSSSFHTTCGRLNSEQEICARVYILLYSWAVHQLVLVYMAVVSGDGKST